RLRPVPSATALAYRLRAPRLGGSSPSCFFFFNDTATTEISPLSLHDALPICADLGVHCCVHLVAPRRGRSIGSRQVRSEEHTSELQSRPHLVCRLLLEKK